MLILLIVKLVIKDNNISPIKSIIPITMLFQELRKKLGAFVQVVRISAKSAAKLPD